MAAAAPGPGPLAGRAAHCVGCQWSAAGAGVAWPGGGRVPQSQLPGTEPSELSEFTGNLPVGAQGAGRGPDLPSLTRDSAVRLPGR